MKNIFTTLTLLLFTAAASPAQNCTAPAPDVIYQNGFTQIAIQQNNQAKYDKAVALLNKNCFMSGQVKNIALLFNDDAYRLEFCKQAYSHTVDRANFYDVYDAFTAFSMAFRLHDYIGTLAQPTPPPTASGPTFPTWAYPATAGYTGTKGCPGPVISEEEFKKIAQNVFSQPTDESKYVAIDLASAQSCLGFAHVMKLASLMQAETLRMRTLMNTFPRVYDQGNYQSGIVLFSTVSAQNEWMSYAKNVLAPPPPPPICKVTDQDFAEMMKNIRAKTFTSEKLPVITLLETSNCFSVEQLRTMSKEFSFGEEKLTVFKGGYAKCPDQNNFYKLVDELSFDSEKNNLRTFIKNGGK